MLGKGYIDVVIVDRTQGGKAYTPAEFATFYLQGCQGLRVAD
jgi:hypothetical protein